jgi:16S rRNA (guanine966-N2)-methyltransferase
MADSEWQMARMSPDHPNKPSAICYKPSALSPKLAMRVIGGNARGRQLKVPKGLALRPTAGRVKEALFNILPHDLSGVKVLDLFAGTGNLTIEALSRGAAEAVLVDSSAQSGKAIRENLRRLNLTDRANLWAMPVTRALRLLARQGQTFDLIFLDPPYEQRLIAPALKIIDKEALLLDSGVLIAEHSIREPIESHLEALALTDQRRYGSTVLSFFRPITQTKSITQGSAHHGA